MEWIDDGIVLARRRHGEAAAIVSLFTRAHGRHLGLVRGGAGRRAAGVYEAGNLLRARWRARLSEHLGSYACEPVEGFAAGVLDDPLRLEGLAAACGVLELALAEREPHESLFDATLELLRGFARPGWAGDYVRWELRCIAEFGFGLDLERCAVSGTNHDLAFVSPRSGRAVSASAGAPYRDRLLALPAFLKAPAGDPADAAEITAGLLLTGHFLERFVLGPQRRALPAARTRLVDRWRHSATISSRSTRDS
ncbi:MAG: DNA repair protein RecO [Proteobacteria bacterium]|nr:DNA repair protein RecO [Pseudomonadota bacterium]